MARTFQNGDQVSIGRKYATVENVNPASRFLLVRYANGSTQWVRKEDVKLSTAQRLADNLNAQAA